MLLTKSDIILKRKPESKEVGLVKNTIVNKTIVNSIDELCDIILKNPFNTSEANGISDKDWISQQIFALDFDGTISIQDFKRRAEMNSLIPNVIYTTLSHTEELVKFRAVFCMEDRITDKARAKWILYGLINLFPEADKACKDLCRMYYPGKDIIYKNDTLNENDFFESILHAHLSKDKRFYENKFEKVEVDIKTVEYYNWDKAIKSIKLLDLFFNHDVRLSYNVLFGLMTNVRYIYGGVKKVLERMKEINNNCGGVYYPIDNKRGVEKYPKEYFNWNHLNSYKYLPTSLENFSPFIEDHEYHNLLELSLKRGEVEIIEPIKRISIEDASDLMRWSFKYAKEGKPFTIEYEHIDLITGEAKPIIKPIDPLFNQLPEYPIYIFKITTGLGKTQTFLNETNALIALPRHKLKNEVSNRMKVDHKVTPKTPLFQNPIVNNLIEQLRDAGLYSEVSNIIKKIANGKLILKKEVYAITDTDKLLAQFWITSNEDCRKDDTTVLTTHKRAVNDSSFKHDFIIFDEDPFSEFVDINSMKIEFSKFDNSPYKDFFLSIENFLRNMPVDCVVKIPLFVIPKGFQTYVALNNAGYIIKFLQSSWVYKSSNDTSVVNFCKQIDLPKDKKIFIMSASAAISVYQKLYGDRVIVVDISNIKSKGVVEQYTKRSFSSTSMFDYNKIVFDGVFNNLNGSKIITHLKHNLMNPHIKDDINKYQLLDDPNLTDPNSEEYNKNHGLYFGNVSGSDKLNGYDVTILGTPHKPIYLYYFIMEMLNLNNSSDKTISNQIINWNGFRFWFMSFENKDLRDIQLSMIESELLQAAGRSRFLRNNNKTKIYSNLPLTITTVFYNK